MSVEFPLADEGAVTFISTSHCLLVLMNVSIAIFRASAGRLSLALRVIGSLDIMLLLRRVMATMIF